MAHDVDRAGLGLRQREVGWEAARVGSGLQRQGVVRVGGWAKLEPPQLGAG